MGWICEKCSTSNFDEDSFCIVCGISKAESINIAKSRITPEERRKNIGDILYKKVFKYVSIISFSLIAVLFIIFFALLFVTKSFSLNFIIEKLDYIFDIFLANMSYIGITFTQVIDNIDIYNYIKTNFNEMFSLISLNWDVLVSNTKSFFDVNISFPFIDIFVEKLSYHFVVLFDVLKIYVNRLDQKIELIRIFFDYIINSLNDSFSSFKNIISTISDVIVKNINNMISFIKSILKI